MDRTWIKYIDLNCLELYPIQFANCDRLAKNDVVYIFDEVGSGKTISSGIMAMDYLYNHDKDVLVITTNALVKENAYTGYGQFINDWFNKLPFQALNLEKRVQVVNNNWSHFADKQEY